MYDVVVIGGGPGGYAAAIRAAQLGGKIAVVEAAELGGTCVNRGCIPTKVWSRAAYLLHCFRHAAEFGISAPVNHIDFKAIVSRKDSLAKQIRMGMESLLANNGIEIVKGQGSIRSNSEISVADKILETKKIIVATGSALRVPNVPGLAEAALTTDEIIDMDQLPQSVLIWGAGPIELEMAAVLAAFGTKVHVTNAEARLLPKEDHDTSQRVTQVLREQGVEVLPRQRLEEVHKADNEQYEAVLAGKEERRLRIERVCVGCRIPYTEGLCLDQAGVRLNDDGSIWVNDQLETSVKGIYAIGDVVGGNMFSHAASSMAVTAAGNALGKAKKYPFHLIPRGIWTIPEVGAVGLTEEEAEKKGFDVEVGNFPYSINGLAMVRSEVDGAVKIVSDRRYGEILGVHIVGAHATELIGEAVLAMQHEATVHSLAEGIRIHPTFSETVVDAARDAGNWALYLPRR